MLFIVNSALTDEEVDATVKKVEAIITKNGGVILGTEKTGLKKFAYTIGNRNDGYYVLTNFEADGNAPKAIAFQVNITEGVVRQMIVAK